MDYVSLISLKGDEPSGECEIGGKAGNLVELVRAGLPVPDGWVVPGRVFEDHLAAHGLVEPAHAVFADGDELRCGEMRQSILSMELYPELLQSFSSLPDLPLAVRSSASVEDGTRGSYSGLFSSCLGVDKGDLGDAVKQVWASVFTSEVLSYHHQVAPGSGYPIMAVLIMPLLDTRISGVFFSADPSDGNPFRMGVSACRGLGTRIVDGVEGGARYVLDFDTLETITASAGHQARGDFLQADGRVATRAVDAEVALSQEELGELGHAVCRIDAILDARVDVEFAFTDRGLWILQTRPLLGLPPYFPDDPTTSNPLGGCKHSTWPDALAPLVRDLLTRQMEHPRIPKPPWPMENTSVRCVHGRAFGFWLPEPPDVRERGRDYLREMEEWSDPEQHFQSHHEWTEDAYEHVLPPIRQGCARLLSLAERELAGFDYPRLLALFGEGLDLEYQAYVFYNSSSYPTSHYVEMTETLLQDWFGFPSPPPRVYSTPAEQLAMELIQGRPTLTHGRDTELQQVASGQRGFDDFICRWGYSYIVRDEQLYLDRWRGWREDAQPLLQAIEQMRRAVHSRSLPELLAESRERAEETLVRTLRRLEMVDSVRYARRARLLAACVRYGRAHFRMKDDRDLIWSHAQAALRWVLMEVARRLTAKGIIAAPDDVFLFDSKELVGFLDGRGSTRVELSALAEDRRGEQSRFARYTPPLNPQADSPAPAEGGVMIGIPTGAGIAEGRAHIVRENTALADLAELEEGDILVFLGEGKVGLTMFFPQIAGLAYSCGNGFSHEVNILRELGKPTIVSLGENAYEIEEGEYLRIDAGKGTVTRLQHAG